MLHPEEIDDQIKHGQEKNDHRQSPEKLLPEALRLLMKII